MSYYRFSEEEVQAIKQRLDDIALTLKQKQRTEPDQIWYDNQEFIQIMNISKRTAAFWRTEKVITYTQVGNKIYYRLSDIMELFNKNTIPAKFSNLKNATDDNHNNL